MSSNFAISRERLKADSQPSSGPTGHQICLSMKGKMSVGRQSKAEISSQPRSAHVQKEVIWSRRIGPRRQALWVQPWCRHGAAP